MIKQTYGSDFLFGLPFACENEQHLYILQSASLELLYHQWWCILGDNPQFHRQPLQWDGPGRWGCEWKQLVGLSALWEVYAEDHIWTLPLIYDWTTMLTYQTHTPGAALSPSSTVLTGSMAISHLKVPPRCTAIIIHWYGREWNAEVKVGILLRLRVKTEFIKSLGTISRNSNVSIIKVLDQLCVQLLKIQSKLGLILNLMGQNLKRNVLFSKRLVSKYCRIQITIANISSIVNYVGSPAF